jgi:beta-galactosidase
MMTIPTLEWLSDVSVFAVNRVPAHSDHEYYATLEEAKSSAPMSMRHVLNGDWKFNYSINPAHRPEHFYQKDFDCSVWGDITVPGHIQLQGYGQPQYVNTMYPWDGIADIRPPEIPMDQNPVGSYVKTFTVPANMQNNPVYISFQGVESAFYVWLNGEFVGYSEDSFTPADFDLTPYITEGENKLAVEVYQRSTGSWLEDQDFWRFSGIFRDVYLYTVPEIHVFDANIRGELDETYTKGNLLADLKFLAGHPAPGKVTAELYDVKGSLVASQVGEIDEGTASISFAVDQPQLWSAENPYLYQLLIHVYNENGSLVEVIPQKVGFRRFEMINKMMKHRDGSRVSFGSRSSYLPRSWMNWKR